MACVCLFRACYYVCRGMRVFVSCALRGVLYDMCVFVSCELLGV